MMSTLPPRNQNLRDLTDAYEAAGPREIENRAALVDLLDCGPMAFDRTHYTPGHVTASAFVVAPDQASVLLIFHRKLGRWLQPGGHVEANDLDMITAARREVTEETGISGLTLVNPGLFDLDIHDIPAHGTTPGHQHFDVRFLFQATNLRLQPSPEVADARWVPLQEVEGLNSDASVMRAVRRIVHEQSL